MKRPIALCLMGILVAGNLAGTECEALQRQIDQATRPATEKLKNAETQLEMNCAAGEQFHARRPFLAPAVDYRLQRLKQKSDRIKLLNDLGAMHEKVAQIFTASSEGTGSIEPLLRYNAATILISRQIDICLLPDAQYAIWQSWSEVQLPLLGQKIKLSNGSGEITSNLYDEEVTREVDLYPDYIFTDNGNSYALVTVDLAKSINTNFLGYFIYRLNAHKKVELVQKLPTILLQKIELKNHTLIVQGETIFDERPVQQLIKL